MKELNVVQVRIKDSHYELFLNGKPECECDFNEFRGVLKEINEKITIDKVEFL